MVQRNIKLDSDRPLTEDAVDAIMTQSKAALQAIIDAAKAETDKDASRRATLVAQRDALNAQINEIDVPLRAQTVLKARNELMRLKARHPIGPR